MDGWQPVAEYDIHLCMDVFYILWKNRSRTVVLPALACDDTESIQSLKGAIEQKKKRSEIAKKRKKIRKEVDENEPKGYGRS